MSKRIVGQIFAVLGIFLFYYCSSPNDVEKNDNYKNSFTPLEIGSEVQFFMEYDSSYKDLKVIGKVFREDGQEVYIIENKQFINLSNEAKQLVIYNTYQFNLDGFLYVTDIARKKGVAGEFYQAKIAKSFPIDGEEWILETPNSPPSGYNVKIQYIGEMETPAGVFDNVYNYQYLDTLDISRGIVDTVNTYYSEGIGKIGMQYNEHSELISYVKLGDKEYGVKSNLD